MNEFEKIGLESETLRCTQHGDLSLDPHPKKFGSPLTFPALTLDFAEAQPELVTPPFEKTCEAIDTLCSLKSWMEEETLLWPLSMPCRLPAAEKIPIATFGKTWEGYQKELYRKGLASRYDLKMQLISGVHVNLSLPIENQKSETYFALIRNVLREGWALTYLFGASPAADISYFSKTPALDKWDETTYYGEYATSLRMSSFGYYSKVQAQLAISYDALWPYVRDIESALITPCAAYTEMGLVNDHYLQIENEHYTRIRPKAILKKGERPIEGLKRGGVDYIEFRGLDLDPFERCGIAPKTIDDLTHFFLYCLNKPSPPLTKEEMHEICTNQNRVALEGRRPNLELTRNGKKIGLQEWLEEIREGGNLQAKKPKSETMLEAMNGKSHITFGLELAKKNRRPKPSKKYDSAAARSIEVLREKEERDPYELAGYEEFERSTQLIIKEAILRGVTLDVIDASASMIRLRRGNHQEIVAQATITSRDPYIVYEVMQNKAATKQLLKEKGFPVPFGCLFSDLEHALSRYEEMQDKKIVIKPNKTNYGVGIAFVEPNDYAYYEKRVRAAFQYDAQVIVEEFVQGKEYRFLIMGEKVVGIANRLPAHIVCDGTSTIEKLIAEKNGRQKKMRPPKERIKLGETEKEFLTAQKLKPSSVPQKGKTVFLRENANISTGGDAIDVTDEVHPYYHKLAIAAAKRLGATITGLDLMIEDISKQEGPCFIIEANHNPHLALHAFPAKGKGRPVAGALLDLLGFPDPQVQER